MPGMHGVAGVFVRTLHHTLHAVTQVQYTYLDASQYFGTKWSQAKTKTPYGQLPIMINKNGWLSMVILISRGNQNSVLG